MNALEIKLQRKILNLTQEDLARKLGVSLKTVSNYENGEVIPESKKELLREVLKDISNNTLNEPSEEYTIVSAANQKAEHVLELIKEHQKVLDLAKENNDQSLINHHTEMIKLLTKQVKLIIKAKKNHLLEK